VADYADAMIDIREYDVPYHMRWLIDTEVRCGWWYNVKASDGDVTVTHRPDLLARGEVGQPICNNSFPGFTPIWSTDLQAIPNGLRTTTST
jgi:DNA polymerase elongation subunit (family B)